MTCYTFTIQYLDGRLIRLFGFSPTSRVQHITSTPIVPLLISPVVDSFVVIGLIEWARRLRLNVAVQIAVAVSMSCFLESPRQPVWRLLAAPIFLIHTGPTFTGDQSLSGSQRRRLFRCIFSTMPLSSSVRRQNACIGERPASRSTVR